MHGILFGNDLTKLTLKKRQNSESKTANTVQMENKGHFLFSRVSRSSNLGTRKWARASPEEEEEKEELFLPFPPHPSISLSGTATATVTPPSALPAPVVAGLPRGP